MSDCTNAADLDFWLPENWPGERAPFRYEVKATGSTGASGRFRGTVEVWVPGWLVTFLNDEERQRLGAAYDPLRHECSALWWSSGGTGDSDHTTEWCIREGRELERQRDEEMVRARIALRQRATIARLRSVGRPAT